MDDLMAFHRYHFAHSRTIQRQKYVTIACFAIIVAAISFAFRSEIPTGTLVVSAVAFSVISGVLYHFAYGPLLERHARKLLSEGGTEGVLCTHELEVDESGLSERTDVNESRHAWSAIDRIEETDDYAFLYVSSVQAHVIPKNSVVAGDLDQFLARARTLFASAREAGS